MWAFLFVGIVVLSFLTPTWADEEVAAYQRLAQARSLKCMFNAGAQADWENGRLNTSTFSNEEFTLHFDSIDTKKRTARLIGNMGAADIATFLTLQGLSFIEKTTAGNVIFTTVFPSYKKGTLEFVAVTSRHMLFPGLQGSYPFPSQRHGTCKVWE